MRSSQKQAHINPLTFSEMNYFHLAEQTEQKNNYELADEFGLMQKDLKQYKKNLNRN